MRRFAVLLGLLVAAAGVALFVTRAQILPAGALPTRQPDTGNGEYLFHAGGCVSCHQSAGNEPGPPLLGGGLAMKSPYGVFHVPNISPDPVHGIGRWTAPDFVNAMKLGTSPARRHYYPAFPYTSYARMSLEDLLDLKSYLDTLPAVQVENLEHELKFPWNIRAGIGLWKMLNLSGEPVVRDLPDDPVVVRGQYLVEGPGHCGECHTPRDWMGGLQADRWLAGAPGPEGEGHVPNITPSGLQGWSQGDIAYYLQSGFTPDFDTVGGSMVKVQKNLTELPVEDLEAMAAYLKAIPGVD